jgi:uncharacterized RmlC-like cupin family protein
VPDDLVRSPSGVLVPASIDPFHRVLHHVAPSGLVGGTAQTSGMRRREAISGTTVGARNLWMGQTHVPGATNSGNHHHGASETAPGDYVFVPPWVPHREENPDPEVEAVVVIARTTQEAVVVNLGGLDWSEVDVRG